MLGFFFWTFLVLFTFVSLFMVLLVLIQKGRGGGLSGAFGGAGGNTAFGNKTGDVLTWVTSVSFGVFLLLAVILNLLADKRQAEATGAVAATPAAVSPAPGAPAGPTPPGPGTSLPPFAPGGASPFSLPPTGVPATPGPAATPAGPVPAAPPATSPAAK